MNTTHKHLILSALISVLTVACGPCAPIVGSDSGPSDSATTPECVRVEPGIATIIQPEANVLSVQTLTDLTGAPCQRAVFQVVTDTVIGNVDIGLTDRNLRLVVNDIPQSSISWGGKITGLARVERSTDTLPAGICQDSVSFLWRTTVGFSTIASQPIGNEQQGLRFVGHQLIEGERISVRFDVCSETSCIAGETRTFTVHIEG